MRYGKISLIRGSSLRFAWQVNILIIFYNLAWIKRRDSGAFFAPESFILEEKMGITELFLIAVGLSMDAFAVSVCKGLSTGWLKPRHYLAVGAWFGGFQALMPAIGYLLGSSFQQYITRYDHWIAFILLAFIGGNMLKEGFSKESETVNSSFRPAAMAVLAVATSIDALAVGITFALLPDVNIIAAVLFIGIITFILSCVGLKIGNVFGLKYKSRAEIAGGAILILIGLKILLEHLGVINF